jgi:hypothetical protein
MLAKILASYSQLPEAQIESWLAQPSRALLSDEKYYQAINAIDSSLLYHSLPEVREAYTSGLPAFQQKLTERYQLDFSVMSAYTLGNWLLGFLQHPEQLDMLLDKHLRLPLNVLREEAPALLSLLDKMSQNRQEWQKALALFMLPLLAER